VAELDLVWGIDPGEGEVFAVPDRGVDFAVFFQPVEKLLKVGLGEDSVLQATTPYLFTLTGGGYKWLSSC